jgi:NifB/MoaA-like Fe-S oxidoreductase
VVLERGMKMVQKINKIGTIEKTVIENVVFTEREISQVEVTEGEFVTVRYMEKSAIGSISETAVIPYETFSKEIEEHIWNTIDNL